MRAWAVERRAPYARKLHALPLLWCSVRITNGGICPRRRRRSEKEGNFDAGSTWGAGRGAKSPSELPTEAVVAASSPKERGLRLGRPPPVPQRARRDGVWHGSRSVATWRRRRVDWRRGRAGMATASATQVDAGLPAGCLTDANTSPGPRDRVGRSRRSAGPKRVFMRIRSSVGAPSRYFGTSGFGHPEAPNGTGSAWLTVAPSPEYLAGFVARHPVGL